MGVGFDLVRIQGLVLKPGEGNRVGLYLDWQKINAQGCAQEPPLGGDEAVEIVEAVCRKAGGRHGDRKSAAVGVGGGFLSVRRFLRLGGILAVGLGNGVLGVEALFLQFGHQRIDVAVVAPVLEADRAILADGDVADLVGKGRSAQVLFIGTHEAGNVVGETLALGAGHVVVDCHGGNLLVFLVVTYSLYLADIASCFSP